METTAGTLSMSLPSPSSSSLLGHIVTIDSIVPDRDFGIKSISLPRHQLLALQLNYCQ